MRAPRPGRAKKPAAGGSPNRLFAVFGVVAALGLLYGWNSIFLGPKNDEAAEVNAELATAKKREQDLRLQLGQLQKLAAETQAREAEIARLGQLIPAADDVAGAILALDEAARQAQVAWSSFVPSPPSPGVAGAPTTLNISIQVGGSFAQIFDYLARLEALDRLTVVDAVTLGGAAGGNGAGGQLNAQIKARMFAGGSRGTATTAASPTTAGAAQDLAKAGG